eukprot:gene8355-11301_t
MIFNKSLLALCLFNLTILHFSLSHSNSVLSTFKTDSLKLDKHNDDHNNGDIGSEALHLMQNHYLKRHLYDKLFWNEWRHGLKNCKNKAEAVNEFTKRFDDPYTRFISKEAMQMKQQQIRGRTVTVGLKLKRSFHNEEIGYALRSYLSSLSINRLFNLIRIVRQNRIENNKCCFKELETNQEYDNQRSKPLLYKIFNIVKGRTHISPSNRSTDRNNINNNGNNGNTNVYCTSDSNMELLKSYSPYFPEVQLDKIDIQNAWKQLKFILISYGTIISPVLAYASPYSYISSPLKRLVYFGSGVTAVTELTRKLFPVIYPIEVDSTSIQADAAGIRVGDRLLSIDNQPIFRWGVDAVQRILESGRVGESMHISILRSSLQHINQNGKLVRSKPYRSYKSFHLNRQSLLINSVTYGVFPPRQGSGVGYIAIKEFSDESFNLVSDAIQSIKNTLNQDQKTKLKALVIDLRGNPGGPVTSALDVASIFLPKGKVLIHMGINNGCMDKIQSKNNRADVDTALLILTDFETASASEILLEALCDNNRAESMGSRTVGKNIAQAIMTLSDGSGLSMTVREYFGPSGKYMGDGHVPKYPVIGPLSCDQLQWNEEFKTWKLNF